MLTLKPGLFTAHGKDAAGHIWFDDLGASSAADSVAPTAWLFGTEAHGLPAQALEAADRRVRIPLRGRAESLNVAAAAAVCLYASARAQRPSQKRALE